MTDKQEKIELLPDEIELIVDVQNGYPKVDNLGRAHCETGPAIRIVPVKWDGVRVLKHFGNTIDGQLIEDWDSEDGLIQYFWHGISIDPPLAKIIIEKPSEITADLIKKLENAEVRRIAIERMGFGNYMQAIKAKVLHEEMVERKKSPRGGFIQIKQQLVQAIFKDDPDGTITGVFAPNSSPNGRFEKEEINWKPLSDFPEAEQLRIRKKYEHTGDLQERDGVLMLRQVIESGEFIPDLDKNGNFVYKMYFMPCHHEIRPFWFRLDENKAVVLDQEGDPVQEFGEIQAPTCTNALASTFGLYGDEYKLDVET